jgi:2-methylcitrate dehydratase PrpD
MRIEFDEIRKKVNYLMGHFQNENAGKNALVDFFALTLKENEICDRYIASCENEGDVELAEFFKEIQAQDHLRAERAKELIHHRLFSR